ncbi:MAG: DUF6703 family protein [Actinomycetota bacterium]
MAGRDRRPGVRGPRGPQGDPRPAGQPSPAPRGPGQMNAFQRMSFPVLAFLTRLPRWLLVIALAGLLVLGVIQSGPLAWLGVLILSLLALFFLWLLVLSWPAIPASGRLLRGIIVIALFFGAYLKAIGRL